MLLDSCPSSRTRNVEVGLPFTLMTFQPEMLEPGASPIKLRGLRIAPAPMPKLSGKSLIAFPVIVVDDSALSVCNCEASALTSTGLVRLAYL